MLQFPMKKRSKEVLPSTTTTTPQVLLLLPFPGTIKFLVLFPSVENFPPLAWKWGWLEKLKIETSRK